MNTMNNLIDWFFGCLNSLLKKPTYLVNPLCRWENPTVQHELKKNPRRHRRRRKSRP